VFIMISFLVGNLPLYKKRRHCINQNRFPIYTMLMNKTKPDNFEKNQTI
jgi:hypothetical protein